MVLLKRTVAVKLAGQSLNLRTEDDPDHVQAVADYLQERMDEIRRGADSASTHQIALLAGIRVVDELFRLRHDLKQLRGSATERARRVLNLLDEQELGETR